MGSSLMKSKLNTAETKYDTNYNIYYHYYTIYKSLRNICSRIVNQKSLANQFSCLDNRHCESDKL